MHDAHAAPATAASRLDDHRIANGTGDLDDFLRIFRQGAIGTGHAGHASRLHGILGRHLVAHQADRFGTRPDEDEAGGFDALGEVGIFRQEAVTRVNGLGVGHFRSGNDGRHIQIAQCGSRRADTHRFVGQLDVLGLTIGLGMHNDRLDAQFATGALYPQGDFTAVGN